MKEQDKAYKKRGMIWLVAYLVSVAITALLFGCLKNIWSAAIGAWVGGIGMLGRFWALRRMTPEQFEAYRKKEKMDNDERTTLIALKSCRAALWVMMLAASAAIIVLGLFCDNDVAMWLTLGLLLLGCAALFIAREVYSRKM